MQLYSVALFTESPSSTTNTHLSFNLTSKFVLEAIAIKAENENEALGMALNYAKETRYPIKKGYVNHQCSVFTVAHDWLLKGERIYAAAILAQEPVTAQPTSFGLTISYCYIFTAISITAENENEALGMALNYARETRYPISDGYVDHQAHIFAIPADWIVKYAKQFQFKAP